MITLQNNDPAFLETCHRWLLFHYHCKDCGQSVNSCEYGKVCSYGKSTFMHVRGCHRNDCSLPRCELIKSILRHHQDCKDVTCQLCAPVCNYQARSKGIGLQQGPPQPPYLPEIASSPPKGLPTNDVSEQLQQPQLRQPQQSQQSQQQQLEKEDAMQIDMPSGSTHSIAIQQSKEQSHHQQHHHQQQQQQQDQHHYQQQHHHQQQQQQQDQHHYQQQQQQQPQNHAGMLFEARHREHISRSFSMGSWTADSGAPAHLVPSATSSNGCTLTNVASGSLDALVELQALKLEKPSPPPPPPPPKQQQQQLKQKPQQHDLGQQQQQQQQQQAGCIQQVQMHGGQQLSVHHMVSAPACSSDDTTCSGILAGGESLPSPPASATVLHQHPQMVGSVAAPLSAFPTSLCIQQLHLSAQPPRFPQDHPSQMPHGPGALTVLQLHHSPTPKQQQHATTGLHAQQDQQQQQQASMVTAESIPGNPVTDMPVNGGFQATSHILTAHLAPHLPPQQLQQQYQQQCHTFGAAPALVATTSAPSAAGGGHLIQAQLTPFVSLRYNNFVHNLSQPLQISGTLPPGLSYGSSVHHHHHHHHHQPHSFSSSAPAASVMLPSAHHHTEQQQLQQQLQQQQLLQLQPQQQHTPGLVMASGAHMQTSSGFLVAPPPAAGGVVQMSLSCGSTAIDAGNGVGAGVGPAWGAYQLLGPPHLPVTQQPLPQGPLSGASYGAAIAPVLLAPQMAIGT